MIEQIWMMKRISLHCKDNLNKKIFFYCFKFKYVRMAIVDHRPITIPNEENKIYRIINGDI